jgi:hypothetical protein
MGAPANPNDPNRSPRVRVSPAEQAAAVVSRVQGELEKLIGKIPTRADLRRSQRRTFFTGLVLVLGFQLLYTNYTWNSGYLGDDRYLVRTNDRLDPSSPITALWSETWWGTRYNGGLYRPFTHTTFALDRAVFGHGAPYRFQERPDTIFQSEAFDDWCTAIDAARLEAINATRPADQQLTQVAYEAAEAWSYHFSNSLLHLLTTAALILLIARMTANGAGPEAAARIDVLGLKKRAFSRIVDAEEKHLGDSADLIASLRQCIAAIGA